MTFYVTPYRRMASDAPCNEPLVWMNPCRITSPPSVRCSWQWMFRLVMKPMILLALVPGLEADDLDIEVLNNTVTIRGEFKDGNEDQSKYLVSELPSGRFGRVITLPTAADAR